MIASLFDDSKNHTGCESHSWELVFTEHRPSVSVRRCLLLPDGLRILWLQRDITDEGLEFCS